MARQQTGAAGVGGFQKPGDDVTLQPEEKLREALGEWTDVAGLIQVARQRSHAELKNCTYPSRGSAQSMRDIVRDLANVCEALAYRPDGVGGEHIDGDVQYLTAALSWYDGGPASDDVHAAWARVKERLSPAASAEEARAIILAAVETVLQPDEHGAWVKINSDIADAILARLPALVGGGKALNSLPPTLGPPTFQSRVQPWMMDCFGPTISGDKLERNDRFIEEALELVQASGYTAERAHTLVDYTFNRPQGEINQEVGGVMVTLAAHCLAHGIDMHEAGETELARINQSDMIVKIRVKQAAKPKHSPLPIPDSTPQPQVTEDDLAWLRGELNNYHLIPMQWSSDSQTWVAEHNTRIDRLISVFTHLRAQRSEP